MNCVLHELTSLPTSYCANQLFLITHASANCSILYNIIKLHEHTHTHTSLMKILRHLLRECIYARDSWSKVNIPPVVVPSFQATDDVNDWLRINCLSKAMHLSSVPWRYIFPFVVWELWKYRNKVVFENIP